ncbi:putative protein disulfide-isomerase A6 [Glycine max]|nr:putative protein disulfide-isomerase A6 [Glycine max]
MFDYVITNILESKTFTIFMTCVANSFMNNCGRSKVDQSLYGLLEPQSIHNAKDRREQCQEYIQIWVKESQRQLYLGAYLHQAHWQLFVLCPRENTVFWFCSLRKKPNINIKATINSAMKTITSSFHGMSNQAAPRWVEPKSHVQTGAYECRYYVMHWMWCVWFFDGSPLDVESITTLRQKWATLFLTNNVDLDGLVVISGDDLNTNVCLLAENFRFSMDFVCPIGFHCATEISALLTPPSPLQVQVYMQTWTSKSYANMVPVDCDEHKSLCSKYGVSGYPTIQWFPKGSLEPKKYEGPRTVDSLAEFVNTEGGTNVKIATAPSNVVVLTSENFNEVVLDETKDVLVRVVNFCKTNNVKPDYALFFLQTYEKVVTAFKLEEDVVIANLDADKYKDLAEKYDVSGFPTLKFFPKGNKAGEEYGGGRDLDDFVAFINEKSGTSRDVKGQLTSQAGIVESLDVLVKEFVAANDEEKKSMFTRMEEEVEKLKGSASRHGKIYLKAAKNYLEKGSDYAKNEIQRLQRILDKVFVLVS